MSSTFTPFWYEITLTSVNDGYVFGVRLIADNTGVSMGVTSRNTHRGIYSVVGTSTTVVLKQLI